jgi:hypothetical protein
MASPTIESRRRRRFLLLSSDEALAADLRGALAEGWEMTVATDVDALGGFEQILQYRFLFLDLDDAAFDRSRRLRICVATSCSTSRSFAWAARKPRAMRRASRAPTGFSSARKPWSACGSSACSTAGAPSPPVLRTAAGALAQGGI